MTANDKDQQDVTESKRILDRVNRESAAAGNSVIDRNVARAKNHFNADDADAEDPIEIWGTRIGRVLGLLVLVAMIIWVISYTTGKS
ncbi:hypothetical protein HB779_03555 [Phyllobacterium sp. 628]|uniref:hypothetical protein n=1 Tax=Phyllobacterium sp. 628 TaxID=2718938 RepID=UPI0016626A56|nr:hypothetical protein [Phyllobacterium sp. 628]QND51069.1 hypothetical protein HB779_03555 [Phyllobacterium sp. 628]